MKAFWNLKKHFNYATFKGAVLRMVTFLLTPNSNCMTSVKDIGLQPSPHSVGHYNGIIQGCLFRDPLILLAPRQYPPMLSNSSSHPWNPTAWHQVSTGSAYTHARARAHSPWRLLHSYLFSLPSLLSSCSWLFSCLSCIVIYCWRKSCCSLRCSSISLA